MRKRRLRLLLLTGTLLGAGSGATALAGYAVTDGKKIAEAAGYALSSGNWLEAARKTLELTVLVHNATGAAGDARVGRALGAASETLDAISPSSRLQAPVPERAVPTGLGALPDPDYGTVQSSRAWVEAATAAGQAYAGASGAQARRAVLFQAAIQSSVAIALATQDLAAQDKQRLQRLASIANRAVDLRDGDAALHLLFTAAADEAAVHRTVAGSSVELAAAERILRHAPTIIQP